MKSFYLTNVGIKNIKNAKTFYELVIIGKNP